MWQFRRTHNVTYNIHVQYDHQIFVVPVSPSIVVLEVTHHIKRGTITKYWNAIFRITFSNYQAAPSDIGTCLSPIKQYVVIQNRCHAWLGCQDLGRVWHQFDIRQLATIGNITREKITFQLKFMENILQRRLIICQRLDHAMVYRVWWVNEKWHGHFPNAYSDPKYLLYQWCV